MKIFLGLQIVTLKNLVVDSQERSNCSKLWKQENNIVKLGYSLDILRQTACLVVNPTIVNGYAPLFNCTTAVRASESMTASS